MSRFHPAASIPAGVLACALAACGGDSSRWQGYVEGEYVRVAAPVAGTLQELGTARGAEVAAGATLFVLERSREQAGLDEAQSRLSQARAREADLGKGRRPEELAVIRAQHAQAQAALRLAEAQLRRRTELQAKQALARDAVDVARAERDGARARVDELAAALATAELAGRPDQVDAARADVAAAEAAVAQAQWQFDQRSASAIAAARVEDTYFRVGEWVPAGTPVLALLPPQNRILRFWVPQDRVASLQPGVQVRVHCDGCGSAMAATVSFVADTAEFTPPVIYSREQRARLVFRVEAKPAAADAPRLPPGLPVDVELAANPA